MDRRMIEYFIYYYCIHVMVSCYVTEVCPANEEYKSCGSACPPTCENFNKRINCIQVCKEGCFCKAGLVRNEDGKCVPSSQCLPSPKNKSCSLNEEYQECGTACPKTCDNYGIMISCVDKCVQGCFCKEGYIRNDDGVCVIPGRCIPGGCPKNEKYSTCVIPCNDCQTQGKCNFLVCNKGCDCINRHYRNENGVCIPQEQCPTELCPINEEYLECGTACPKTCDNYGAQIKCIDKCIPGCFCKEGYIRDDNGVCVVPEQCIPGGCPKNEKYSTCVIPCNDCQTQGKCDFLVCNKGCDCIDRHYRNENGVCIPQEQCPTECTENEYYDECKTDCEYSCRNYSSDNVCQTSCKKGCFCVEGHYRNDNDVCVPLDECLMDNCSENEEYFICMPTCNNTCENYNKVLPCPLICEVGCDCKEGLVRRKDGQCVPPNMCEPKNDVCPQNEVYSDCVNPCNNCSIKGKCQFLVCNKGCDCRKGYYRNRNKVCIPESQCPPARRG